MSGFDDFFNAIAQQESGGNYSAVNSRTGASGKYQIMPANIGPWSRQYLGQSVSVDQFRQSPGLQESLARAVLSSYYNQYGARGAASTWYSGSPNGQNNYRSGYGGEPSIGSYVDQVVGRMGMSPSPSAPQAPIPGFPASTPVATPTPTPTGAPTPAASPLSAATGVGLEAADGSAPQGAVGLGASDGTSVPQDAVTQDPGPAKPGAIAPVTTLAPTGSRQAVLDLAKQWEGTPYVWGGESPSGFDCSGLVQYAMKQVGLNIPRISYAQLASGQRTDIGKLQPGDLIGWGDGHHVALYAGNNQIIEAPRTGLNVRERALGSNEGAWGVSLSNLYG